MLKKVKVVMLPTEKARLHKYHFREGGNCLIYDDYEIEEEINKAEPQHLYFLLDEEIKKGDIILTDKNEIIKAYCFGKFSLSEKFVYPYSKKIIASTDKSLELPRPSDSFIKKYCEVDGIDEVLVEYEEYYASCEEIRLKIAQDNTITIKKINNNWNESKIKAMFHKFTQELKGKFSDEDTRMMIQSFSNKWVEENI